MTLRVVRRVTLAVTVLAAVAVSLPAAAAAALTPETITLNWVRSGSGAGPPYRGTGAGTFSVTGPVTDAGSLTVAGQDTGVFSPVMANSHTDDTLTGSAGTLALRCSQHANDFSNLAAVPVWGSCTITSGTGAYANQRGYGIDQAVVDLFTNTVTEVISFNVTS